MRISAPNIDERHGLLPNIDVTGVVDSTTGLQAWIDTAAALVTSTSAPQMLCLAIGSKIKLNSGITIPVGKVGVDFNGALIDASAMTTGYAISLVSAGGVPYSRRAASLPIGGFTLINMPLADTSNPDTSDATGIRIHGTAGNGEISGTRLHDVHVWGFRDAFEFGDYAYICQLHNVNVEYFSRYGVNFQGATTAGENMHWFGGRIAGGNNVANEATAVYMPDTDAGNNGLSCHGVSFDYNDRLCLVEAGVLSLIDCHVEDDHETAQLIVINAAGSGILWSGVRIIGGRVYMIAATGRPRLVSLSGAKGFFRAATQFDIFDQDCTIVEKFTAAAIADLTGSNIDYADSGGSATRWPNIGADFDVLMNGDFELGNANGWAVATYTISATTTGTKSGTYKGASSSAGSSGSIYQRFDAKPGQRVYYDLSASVTVFTAGTMTLRLRFYGDDAATQLIRTDSIKVWSAVGAGYETFHSAVIAPGGSKKCQVEYSGASWNGTLHIDDNKVWVL